MDLKRAKQLMGYWTAGKLGSGASHYEVGEMFSLAIQRLTQREALRKKAAKRRKMMKRGGGV